VEQHGNLSPFTLNSGLTLQPAPQIPHQGLHGVFGDCLPDGWGLLLQDRVFRQQGIAPTQLTAMDRLATQVGFTDWKQALSYAQESVGVLSTFAVVAQAPRSESQHH